MIYWDEMAFIALLINLIIVLWIVLGYYAYKKYLETHKDDTEIPLGDYFKQFNKDLSDKLAGALDNIVIDVDTKKISEGLTETFFGTFLAILGVTEEYNEDWSFRNYIKEIIDSSVTKIVPETIKEFQAILPEFAEQFVGGLQEALAGATTQGAAPAGGAQPVMQQAVQQGLGNLDIGEMMKMMLLQFVMSKMGGMGGITSGLTQLAGPVAGTPARRSGF